jgi:hypothetical protein
MVALTGEELRAPFRSSSIVVMPVKTDLGDFRSYNEY